MLKKLHWFEIFLLIAILGINLYAAFSDPHNFPNRWFTRDDAYYYFKVAQNIGEGHGVTFDGINPTNGFHPLWMLVCIPIFTLARFDLILPLRVLLLVLAALSAGTGLLLFRTVRRVLSEPAAIFATALWCFGDNIHRIVYQIGIETGLTAFALILFLHQLVRLGLPPRPAPLKPARIVALAASGLFLVLSRLDTIFLVLVLGAWIILRESRVRVPLLADLLTIPGVILASFAWRAGFPYYYNYTTPALLMAALSLVIRLPLYFFAGLYRPPGELSLPQLGKRILLAVTGASVIVSAVMLVLGATPLFDGFPRSALAVEWIVSLAVVAAIRLGWMWLGQREQAAGEHDPRAILRAQWRRWFREGFIYFGILGAGVGLYMLYNQITLGVAMPVSGEIKRWWGWVGGVYGGPSMSVANLFGLEPTPSFSPWGLLLNRGYRLAANVSGDTLNPDRGVLAAFLGLAILGIVLIVLLNRRRVVHAANRLLLFPLFIGAELQALSYGFTGYAAAKDWYWVAQMLLLVLAAALALDVVRSRLPRSPITGRWVRRVMAAFALGLAAQFAAGIVSSMVYVWPRPGAPYMDAAAMLEKNTEPGALIGMTGGGNVGYFIHDRTIVNLDGLINSPAYFESLRNQTAGDYLESMGLDYIFANPEIMDASPIYRYIMLDRQIETKVQYGAKALMKFGPRTPREAP